MTTTNARCSFSGTTKGSIGRTYSITTVIKCPLNATDEQIRRMLYEDYERIQYLKIERDSDNVYTCSFCGKRAQGRPITFLKVYEDRLKVKLNGSNVALMPEGWDWDIQEYKFNDLFSCGCHKFNRNK